MRTAFWKRRWAPRPQKADGYLLVPLQLQAGFQKVPLVLLPAEALVVLMIVHGGLGPPRRRHGPLAGQRLVLPGAAGCGDGVAVLCPPGQGPAARWPLGVVHQDVVHLPPAVPEVEAVLALGVGVHGQRVQQLRGETNGLRVRVPGAGPWGGRRALTARVPTRSSAALGLAHQARCGPVFRELTFEKETPAVIDPGRPGGPFLLRRPPGLGA